MSIPTSGVTLGAGIVILLAAKRAANFRPRYIDSLRMYLSQFAKGREDLLLSEVTVEIIESWFAGRTEALATRRSNSGRLSSLFSFGEKRGWVVRNPMKLLDTVRLDHRPPKILTVEQSQRLMNFGKYQQPHSVAFLALALFAGVRPEELQQVTWDNIGSNIVTIDAAASKVRRRRIVHLPANAIEWIAFARETGARMPFVSYDRRTLLPKAAKHLGFPSWPHDVMRHTAASMWLAVSDNVGMVSKELGNSPGILLTNYQELVTADNAAAFWQIRP